MAETGHTETGTQSVRDDAMQQGGNYDWTTKQAPGLKISDGYGRAAGDRNMFSIPGRCVNVHAIGQ